MQKVRWKFNFNSAVVNIIKNAISGLFTLSSENFSPFLRSTSPLSLRRFYLDFVGGPTFFKRNFSCSALLKKISS